MSRPLWKHGLLLTCILIHTSITPSWPLTPLVVLIVWCWIDVSHWIKWLVPAALHFLCMDLPCVLEVLPLFWDVVEVQTDIPVSCCWNSRVFTGTAMVNAQKCDISPVQSWMLSNIRVEPNSYVKWPWSKFFFGSFAVIGCWDKKTFLALKCWTVLLVYDIVFNLNVIFNPNMMK